MGIVRRWAYKASRSALMLLLVYPNQKNRFDSKFGRSSERDLSVSSTESFERGDCNLGISRTLHAELRRLMQFKMKTVYILL